ncbi:hypothetical protein NE857_05405 [Nocardiopsis exhalans]|uniref:Uncharacterized protein n=1 Tax=Nocardiopsis exhalans TaxID=163604 RepID=A0ABY5DHL7_9ACTN|nr:hypothetical protein [Nocardiopsis exhalans]USY23527.1 hypothetical protein NE857_05405 [Nocardiopsis exhalans]
MALWAPEALRAQSSLGILASLGARATLGTLPALGGLRELAGRREALRGLRRLRAARSGVRRELRSGGARAGNPWPTGRTGRAERLLRARCGRLALRLGGRPEQVRTFAALRLERSSVWAVLRRVRMGADGSLRRL